MFATTVLAAFLTAGSAFGASEIFRVWRTPEGTIYVGDRPPQGSSLVQTMELASTASESPAAAPPGESPEALAARDGRELIRQRAAEREARRDRELTRELHEGELVDTVPPLIVVSNGGHRRFRHHPIRRGIGPSPIAPWTEYDPRLVTPDFGGRANAGLEVRVMSPQRGVAAGRGFFSSRSRKSIASP